MGKRVLFSPIGGTDPIKYLRDGSMLHICRHYCPDIVYLYMSAEIMACHRKDDRYVATLRLLGQQQGHEYQIHIISREELTAVQQYDYFYQDFREIIRKIERELTAEDELFINMASGTPAMKSALLVMATLTEYRFRPIQVSTPQKAMNSELENRKDYDVEGNWELDEDNDPTAENRCTEVRCMNLIRLLKLDMMKKHILAYDYVAALSVAEEMMMDISEDAWTLLMAARARCMLDHAETERLLRGKEWEIYPIQDGDKKKIFEYALNLQIKVRKGENADFVRGLTPLVVNLFETILKNACGIDYRDYCYLRKNVWNWNLKKLEQVGLLSLLNRAYSGSFRGGPVYSHHIVKIMRVKLKDIALMTKINKMAEVEQHARNIAAHSIVSVTDEWYLRETGITIQETMQILKTLVVRAGIPAKKDDWNSYDDMNRLIIKSLED